MDAAWEKQFRHRMDGFARQRGSELGRAPVSIKVRVASGCFHREHSPRAYDVIERSLSQQRRPSEFEYVEHESGPELLVYIALGTACITLAKSVIDLVTTIIKARSEGVKKGDKPSEPLELIVRRMDEARQFKEEVVLRIGHTEKVDAKAIDKQLTNALQKLMHKRGDSDG